MTAEDADLHRRDLRAAIDRAEGPEWRLEMQVMPFAGAADYHDTHLHRIGANYEQLPINAPRVDVHSYRLVDATAGGG